MQGVILGFLSIILFALMLSYHKKASRTRMKGMGHFDTQSRIGWSQVPILPTLAGVAGSEESEGRHMTS